MELSSDFGETMPPFKRGLTCPCLDRIILLAFLASSTAERAAVNR